MSKKISKVKVMKKISERSPFPSPEATEMKKAEAKRGINNLVQLTRVAYR